MLRCAECRKKATVSCVECGALFCDKCNVDGECLYCDPVLVPIKRKKERKGDKNE